MMVQRYNVDIDSDYLSIIFRGSSLGDYVEYKDYESLEAEFNLLARDYNVLRRDYRNLVDRLGELYKES